MPKTQEYSEKDKQKALQMTRDGISVTKICDAIGCSRATYYNWKNDGVLTDGVPWDEWLENHEQFEVAYVGNKQMEVKVEKADEFWEENIPKLRRGVQRTIEKIGEGEMILGPDELETIVSLIRKVENRGKELRSMHRQFMRKAFIAIRETEGIDAHKFELIKEKIKAISMDQLQEVDPEYAETAVEDAT